MRAREKSLLNREGGENLSQAQSALPSHLENQSNHQLSLATASPLR